MSIVTKLPNVSAQSRPFISGRLKTYMAWLLIYTDGGGGKRREKAWAGRKVAVCVLLG